MLAPNIGRRSGLDLLSQKHDSGNYAPKMGSPLSRRCVRLTPAGVSARWLAAFEAGADDTFVSLTAQMRKNLELLARLTRELVPQPSVVTTTNNFMLFEHPEYVQVIAALSMALRPFPEARQAVLATLRSFRTADARVLIDAQPTIAR
jgi:hypothetical protein